jgi:enterochelin esterase-like enzyme
MHRYTGEQAVRDVCLILLVAFGTCFNVAAQQAGLRALPPPKYPEVTIPNTELRTVRSQIVDQEFNIYIQLPLNYSADTGASYPVLYVTDANRSFPWWQISQVF